MNTPQMSPDELRRVGLDALVKALGYAGMIRFIREFYPGEGDYTRERQEQPDTATVDELMDQIRRRREEHPELNAEPAAPVPQS